MKVQGVSYNNYLQHPRALKILADHASEKPKVTKVMDSAIVWQWSDGYAVLKSFLAAIAYYDKEANEVFTVKRYSPKMKKHIELFKDLMIKK